MDLLLLGRGEVGMDEKARNRDMSKFGIALPFNAAVLLSRAAQIQVNGCVWNSIVARLWVGRILASIFDAATFSHQLFMHVPPVRSVRRIWLSSQLIWSDNRNCAFRTLLRVDC